MATLLLLPMAAVNIAAQPAAKAFDPAHLDTSVRACDNFFQFANGSWLRSLEIPAARPSFGSFVMLRERNQELLHQILEDARQTKAPAGSARQMIGDFYGSCMDEVAIEAAGIRPVEPLLRTIDAVRTREELPRLIARLHDTGRGVVFGFGGLPDYKNSQMRIATARQGGLSLPNADYYTKDDVKSKATREEFVAHVGRMLRLAGETDAEAKAHAATVFQMELRLAKASLAPVEMRNPENRYNKISLREADALTPAFSWTRYLQQRKAPAVPELNIAPPKFFQELNAMLGDVAVGDWKTYLRWHVLRDAAPQLTKALEEESWKFNAAYLTGAKAQQPRWHRCVEATDGALGEALGRIYVEKHYPPAAKQRMDALIDNLMAAYRERLKRLDWLSDETRKQALAKLDSFRRKIGYPEKWRGYAGLTMSRKVYAENWATVQAFEEARDLQEIGQPVDRTRWHFTTPTVNASYSPPSNEITFPAGILQPPFFHFDADDAINYGAIGAVIGHEITHGFDDSGSRFDREGNLKMWWTADDRKRFEERAECVVRQFNGYEVMPGLHINGKLTLGENIADLGGLLMAWEAFQRSRQGKAAETIDGFTPEQRFFLGWAQIWAAKYRPEAMRSQVLGDPHSNAVYRVNGPLSNLEEFRQAFGCKDGDAMVRANGCKVW
ncbi:MAG: M13 family metallopeptidase [Bryobacterales bacterium]|nr:M13 family metallopeptidase [Bryobacterales bacterium]